MGNTKKVRTAGRFGSRYGVGIRKKLLKVEDKQKKNYACPFCGFKKVKRKAAGLYACGKCHASFAGGAYLPITLPGSIIKKTVAQKSFVSKNKEFDKIDSKFYKDLPNFIALLRLKYRNENTHWDKIMSREEFEELRSLLIFWEKILINLLQVTT